MDYTTFDIYWAFYKAFLKNGAVVYSLIIAKAITSFLIVIQGARLYFSSHKLNNTEHSFTYYDLFRPFFLIIIIMSYSYIMDTFDSVAVESERYVYSQMKVETSVSKLIKDLKPKAKEEPKPSNDSFMSSVTEGVSDIATYLEHPSLIVIKILDFIMAAIDYMGFIMVMIFRFASLFILRFLGPIAIAASIYHRFEGWWANWLKAYGLLYVWVLTIFAINFFTAGIAYGVYRVMVANRTEEVMLIMAYNSTAWCLIVLKIYMYFKSKKIIAKIFA